jgi:hypothetical protein
MERQVDTHLRPIAPRYLSLFGESHRCRYIAHHAPNRDSHRRQIQHLRAIKEQCDSLRS